MFKKVLLFALLATLPSWAIEVRVDGRALGAAAPAVQEQGRVSVPMRAVFEALGAEVDYRAGRIVATRGESEVRLTVGSRQAEVDGQVRLLDVPAQLRGSSTYVPLRFVAEALGEEVQWQANERRVLVGSSTLAAEVFPAKLVLPRLVVGNQGAILKVRDGSLTRDVYYRGLDDRNTARYSTADQTAILNEMGIVGPADGAAEQLMSRFDELLPREATALLGLIGSLGEGDRLKASTAASVRGFLTQTMQRHSDVAVRRQAVLALAVGGGLDGGTVQGVLDFYQKSENLWETFPVQQFFEYHAGSLRTGASLASIRERIAEVNSLYTPHILGYLDS